MVNHTMRAIQGILMTAAYLLASATAVAGQASECVAGSEFSPPRCPLHIPAIEKVTVEADRQADSEDQKEACASFAVDSKQAKFFLEHAWTVSWHDSVEVLNWSPCSAEGLVEFVDGQKGKWYISEFGRGSLVLGNNRPLNLYCSACEQP